MKESSVLMSLALILCSAVHMTHAAYKIGVGRADCTGPSAEITFMGYAKAGQRGCGIHLRQYSRAYIFDDGKKRVAFVTVDACMMNHGIRKAVLSELKDLYNDTYTIDNLILSGTHTHSAPGGFMQDVMLDVPNMGFVQETFDALVSGIVKSIKAAHKNMQKARIFLNNGEILDANINRSPAAYLLNPKEERDRYKNDVDKEIVQLKFVRSSDNKTIGAINWFAVHPTSMNNTNCLISSDNVGYASILFETSMDTHSLPGQSGFVGAFASTNLGDVSPNTNGPKCINTGEPCDGITSTCNNTAKYCIAFGPGKDMEESTKIIANKLFKKAEELIKSESSKEVKGDIKYVHQFVHMPTEKITVQLENGTKIKARGCLPAMGYSFAAGTIDGPGEFDFKQATTTSNAFWNLVRDFIFPPMEDDVRCHAPKPILIMTGSITLPYEWQPSVVSTQLAMIGNVAIAAVPGEFTTMSGRRLRNLVSQTISENGGPTDVKVIIAGLSNVYTSYIATFEEYQMQRYEGASTIFGPHTLSIYLNKYKELSSAMLKNRKLEAGPQPFEFPKDLLSLVTPVLFDSSGWFNNFGDCIQQPPSTVKIGDTVKVKFIAGHPRNDLRQGDTFLTVEKVNDESTEIIATDSSWETKFIWKRTENVKGSSEAEIHWKITNDVEPGTYRIRHYGSYKYFLGGIYPYQGKTKEFTVTE
nr:neutral ceramidase [Leptinotarsa decemlineata]